ncbi:MAG: T9SS type A sorting domain-containing protein [Crocinitomicaceae bacterium]|nr:T9SS type A sorting domain-containing protein [Crocinitomicaceae bacterium]
MKNIVTTLFLLLVLAGYSQEVLSPLTTNPSLYRDQLQVRAQSNLDSTFVYSFGTLSIADVWDDFSVNKFVKYPPNYTDGNVTSLWYYYLMNSSNTLPEPVTVKYCDSTHAKHDTISVVGGIPSTFSYYFTPHSIWVNDLTTYPIGGQLRTLYDECYVIIDSIIDGVPDPTQDTIWYTSTPDFEQDSIHLFFANMNDPNQIWVDNSAYHNYRFAVDPWSLGVVTFDGVDSTGWPYNFGNTNAHGEADVLTSKPINLLGSTNDVFLQFLYQAEGHGNMPDQNDTLLVDFFLVDSNEWYNVWKSTDYFPWMADQWDTAFIVVQPNFLKNGFRFRFRNYASTSGALDHWHVDYVQLYNNPLFAVQPFKDLAISYPVNTLLEDYTSVPWDHYQNLADKNDVLIDTAFLHVYNSDDTPTNVGSDMYLKVDEGVVNLLNYNIPNPAGPSPWTSNWELGVNDFPYFVQINFPSSYVDAPNDTMAIFNVKINANADVAASNVYTVNDTTTFQQVFKNYYSYDDGSAEVAYGIQGSNSQLAYEFNAYEADTLTGILMHFVPSVTNVSNYIMLLTIWDDNNGEPGNILYQDDYFTPHYPEYSGSIEGFRYYQFVNPDYASKIPVPQKFYVGWEQIESQSLNIGMDRNTNSGSKIRYNVGGSWLTSSQQGSLMIRPVFSTNLNYTLGIEEKEVLEEKEYSEILMFPNPTKDIINFSGVPESATIAIYDMSGRLVYQGIEDRAIEVGHLESGLYVVDIRDAVGVSLFSEKLIKE